MSNPDPHPVETVCAATGDDSADYELLEPREVPLGGLRAMTVRRTLPQRARSLIGAWCFLDHYGPDDVRSSGGMDVAAHPHIGLQTVSWLFSGEIDHRDSTGFHATVRPGELNLMTAGRGISHSERSTSATSVLHGAQLWIALPERRRGIDPGFEHYAPPLLHGDGWAAQVFLGSLLGDTAPIRPHTPLLGAEIRLDPGAVLEIPVDTGFEHGALVDSGDIVLERIAEEGAADSAVAPTVAPELSVAQDRLAYTPPGASRLRVTAGATGARLLLLGGEPLGERIVMWWNFVGRDHDEIARARIDWQARLSAVGVADPSETRAPGAKIPETRAPGTKDPGVGIDPDPARFALPEHEPEPPLPAPALPIARLVPRRR